MAMRRLSFLEEDDSASLQSSLQAMMFRVSVSEEDESKLYGKFGDACKAQQAYKALEYIRILKERNLDVVAYNIDEWGHKTSSLLFACQLNQIELVNKILENPLYKKVYTETDSRTGLTPFLVACTNNNPDIGLLLLSKWTGGERDFKEKVRNFFCGFVFVPRRITFFSPYDLILYSCIFLIIANHQIVIRDCWRRW